MKWFRSNIKHGSRLALLALALQFGLSFGHFHAGAAQAAAPIGRSASDISHALATPDVVDPSAPLPASHNDTDQHPGEACAICAVIALAEHGAVGDATAIAAAASGGSFATSTADAEFVHLNSARPRVPASRSPRLLTSIA